MDKKYNVCRHCVKREFSRTDGLLCSLTSAKPNFKTYKCHDYEQDFKVKKEVKSTNPFPKKLTVKEKKNDLSKSAKNARGLFFFGAAIIIITLTFSKLNQGAENIREGAHMLQKPLQYFLVAVIIFTLISLIFWGVYASKKDNLDTE